MLSRMRYQARPVAAQAMNPSTEHSVLELSHDVDENGSPAYIDPQVWYVCFVPGLKKQWWHKFVSGWQHVFLIRPDGRGGWTLFEPWWTRLLVSTITTGDAVRFLRWASLGKVLMVCEHVPGNGSQMRGWMNCAALAAFLLGRNYLIWSPNSLYRKLRSEPNVSTIDVADLLVAEFARVAEIEIAPIATCNFPLEDQRGLWDALMRLGTHVVTLLARPAVNDLTRSAVAEAYRFPGLGKIVHDNILGQCIAATREVLLAADDQALINITDIDVAATFFVQSLFADVCLKVTLNLAAPPSCDHIESKVASVVELLLAGATAAPQAAQIGGGRGD